jgi:hypothetical protein
MNKKTMYKTAMWDVAGEFVSLVKYHVAGDWYEIRTISGESLNVQASELSEFVL